MTSLRARAFQHLHYMDPRSVLLGLRRIELSFDANVPAAVRHLRTRDLKPLREFRAACLFCYGWEQIDGQKIYVAQAESQDYDAVAMYEVPPHRHFAPIQVKEVVPNEVNPAISIQDVVNGLQKYGDSRDLTVVVHLNRVTRFSLSQLVIPPLKIAALWIFGAIGPNQQRWVIWGSFLENVRWGEFEYPTEDQGNS
jgi:hypothetical protein